MIIMVVHFLYILNDSIEFGIEIYCELDNLYIDAVAAHVEISK